VIAGAAVGGWRLAGHVTAHGSALAAKTGTPAATPSSPAQASQGSQGSASPATPASGSPTTPGPSSAPSATASAPETVGTVTVTSAAAQDQAASAVAGLVNRYFAAINAHDYQAYISLLTAQQQQGMTSTQFANGYRTTVDSNESLVGISSAANGDTVAQVTFTSHQNPAESVNGAESCTDWQISLFLVSSGGGYLIDQPASGYHASYAAC
jgi:hypothetical protein